MWCYVPPVISYNIEYPNNIWLGLLFVKHLIYNYVIFYRILLRQLSFRVLGANFLFRAHFSNLVLISGNEEFRISKHDYNYYFSVLCLNPCIFWWGGGGEWYIFDQRLARFPKLNFIMIKILSRMLEIENGVLLNWSLWSWGKHNLLTKYIAHIFRYLVSFTFLRMYLIIPRIKKYYEAL